MNTLFPRNLSGSLGFLLLSSLGASAGDVVDTTPPNNQAGMSSQAGQTFTTGVLGAEDKLSNITIITAAGSGAGTGPFTLKIFNDVDQDFQTWDPGTEIAASTNTASLTPFGNTAIVFNFSAEELQDNTVYAFSFNDGTIDHAGFRAGLTNAGGVAIADGALFSGGAQPFGGAFDVSCIISTIDPGNFVTWTAATDTVWDVATTANWQVPGPTAVTFANGNDAIFDDTDPTGTVVLSGSIEPGSVLFDATTTSYTLTGDPIAGTGGLTVSQGNVTLGNDNSYTGTTIITAGTLTIGTGGTSGSLGTGAVTNSGSLVVDRDGTPTISNAIGGAGDLTVSGPGTVTLSGDSSFTGGTTILDGTTILGDPDGIGRSGAFGGQISIVDGVFDVNGQTNYSNVNQGGSPSTWLTTATVTLGGSAGATPEIADNGGTPAGIAFASGKALVYDATNDPGTATVSALWAQVGSSNPGGSREVEVGDSSATSVEVDFAGGLGDLAAWDGRNITVLKTGPGTMQISNANNFPRLQVSEGTLLVNDTDALGSDRTASGGSTSRLTVDGTGVVDLNGFSPSTGALADNGVNTGTITNNAAATTSTLTVGSAGATTAYKGAITDGAGTVALSLEGGQLTLGETKTYTGATTVTGGTLFMNTTAMASPVTVESGGAVSSGNDSSIGTGVLDTLSLNGGTATFRIADPTSDKLVVGDSNGFSIDAPSVVEVDVDPGVVAPFTVPIIEYAGSIQGAAGFAGLAVQQHGPTSLNDTGSAIELTVTGDPADTLIWVGNVDGNWTINGDSNWKLLSDSSSVPFYAMDKVLFDDTATGPTTVTLGAAFSPETVEFNNSTLDYTLKGAAINGSTGIVKNGTATATILADCGYTGGTTVNAGTLAFGNGGTDGEPGFGDTSVASGATLEINTSDFLDFKATAKLREVGGAGDIVLTGGGTLWNYPGTGLTFSGEANSWDDFSGTLTVKGGSEFQTIRNGATAMGTGNIVLGDGASSGVLSQIEGNWTWTNPIEAVGSDNLILNRSAVGPRSLKLQGPISGAGNLTFLDAVSGMTDVNRGFVITNDVTMTGTITIDTGVPVRVGGVPGEVDVSGTGLDADSSGSLGTTTVVNDGTLTFSRTDAHTIGSAISGFGDVRIGMPSAAGRGDTSTQVVTIADATKTYEGTTAVESGTLLVNGTLPNSLVDVNPEGTLGGTGTVGSSTLAFGTLAPGASVGTLTFGDELIVVGDASYTWEISDFTGSAGSGYDTLAASSIEFVEPLSLSDPITAANPVTIVVTPDSVANFSETTTTFTLATSAAAITVIDLDAIEIDDSAFATATGSTGSWDVQLGAGDLSLELVYTAGAPADDYAAWIAGFPGVGAMTGFNDDPDGDGIENGVENFLGTAPDVFNAGLTITGSTGTSVTATHTQTNDPASDVTGGYEWSSDLASWNASGATDGNGVEVTINAVVTDDQVAPALDTVEVTATIDSGPSERLFLRATATQTP